LLVQVTVLIGIAYKGRAVAGIIHQPFFGEHGRTIWGIEGVGVRGLDVSKGNLTALINKVVILVTGKRVIVTTRSHSTALVQSALDSLKDKKLLDELERVGGAGYKVLKCLEGAAAYVFASGGCKKWDTCAPEAVIRSAGGELTDISGRRLNYEENVQRLNSGGVLASSPGINHKVVEHILII
jgi:3'(2'), 5'-bisphosphate nucleotidase